MERFRYLCTVNDGKEFFHSMKYSELKRRLRKAGCFLLRQGGRHEVWKNPANGHTTMIGRHDAEEVKKKTLQTINKELFGR